MILFANIFDINITWIVIWVAIFLIALAIELSTEQLVSIWFCGGAVIGLILACCSLYWWIQLIVFIIVTVLLLVLSKLFIKKDKDKSIPTNADNLIGEEILVLQDVSPDNRGEGKIRDVIWTIAVQDNSCIKKGEYAIIEKIVGNKLIVTKKGDKEND